MEHNNEDSDHSSVTADDNDTISIASDVEDDWRKTDPWLSMDFSKRTARGGMRGRPGFRNWHKLTLPNRHDESAHTIKNNDPIELSTSSAKDEAATNKVSLEYCVT